MMGIMMAIIFCCCGSAPAGDMRICRYMMPPMISGVMK
jgi:hypothetical protein